MAPSRPDCINTGADGCTDDELDVAIVVGVGASRYFNKLVSHSDMLCICFDVFWSGHGNEVDCTLITKGFVGSGADGADELDSRKTVVGDENRVNRSVATEGFDFGFYRGCKVC